MTLPHVATSAVWASAANRAGLGRRNLDEGGWGQNTKEYDPASELTYMYQRWYDPALGIFTSTAPYPPMIEHPYTFAEGNPVMRVDPDGRNPNREIWQAYYDCIARWEPTAKQEHTEAVEAINLDYDDCILDAEIYKDSNRLGCTIGGAGVGVGIGVAAGALFGKHPVLAVGGGIVGAIGGGVVGYSLPEIRTRLYKLKKESCAKIRDHALMRARNDATRFLDEKCGHLRPYEIRPGMTIDFTK